MSGLLDDAIRSYPQHEPGAWWVPASYGGTAPTLERRPGWTPRSGRPGPPSGSRRRA